VTVKASDRLLKGCAQKRYLGCSELCIRSLCVLDLVKGILAEH